MKLIILSGGSGKRLWPLSNDVRSKQFLKLLESKQGKMESMIQRVFNQVRMSGIDSEIVIATSSKQVDSVRHQLEDSVDIVVEPDRRDTFPAIVLAAAYMYYIKGSSLNETISIIPVDPYTNIDYFLKLKELNHLIENDEFRLGLLGIKPTYPSSKYGYILNNNKKVTGFIEKPSENEAELLIKDNAYWNAGVFVFKLRYILDILSKYIDYTSYEDVLNQYYKLPKNSFDYEVSEKESDIGMLTYEGEWKDLGTWKTLTEEMKSNKLGDVTISDSSIDTHVINETNVPIITIGTNNLIVAASPDGILVSDKVESAQLKKYISNSSSIPKYEEKEWGTKEIIDYCIETKTTVTKILTFENQTRINESLNDITITIIEGKAELVVSDNETSIVYTGDTIKIKKNSKYYLTALTDLQYIEIEFDNN